MRRPKCQRSFQKLTEDTRHHRDEGAGRGGVERERERKRRPTCQGTRRRTPLADIKTSRTSRRVCDSVNSSGLSGGRKHLTEHIGPGWKAQILLSLSMCVHICHTRGQRSASDDTLTALPPNMTVFYISDQHHQAEYRSGCERKEAAQEEHRPPTHRAVKPDQAVLTRPHRRAHTDDHLHVSSLLIHMLLYHCKHHGDSRFQICSYYCDNWRETGRV